VEVHNIAREVSVVILDCYYKRRRNPVLCWFLLTLTDLFYRIEVRGARDFPKYGPVILAPKHASIIDPFVCSIAWYKLVGHRHPAWYFAKAEMFRSRPIAWFMSALGTFPVRRGKADRKALKFARELLEDNSVLMIFPEGTRSETLGEAKSGLGYLACATGAPVKPMMVYGLKGWGKFILRRKITVRFGECLFPNDEGRGAFTVRLMEAILKL